MCEYGFPNVLKPFTCEEGSPYLMKHTGKMNENIGRADVSMKETLDACHFADLNSLEDEWQLID